MRNSKEVNVWIKTTLTYAAVSGGHVFSSDEINQAITHICKDLPKEEDGAVKSVDITKAFLNAAKDFSDFDPTEPPDPDRLEAEIAASAEDDPGEPPLHHQHMKVLQWMYRTVALVFICTKEEFTHEKIEYTAATEIINKVRGNRQGMPSKDDLDYMIRATVKWSRQKLGLEPAEVAT